MPKMNITTNPLSAFSKKVALVGFVAAVAFLVILMLLHILEPEVDPTWRFISDYELGFWGWLMRLAFFLLMISSVSLFIAIRSQIRTVGGYLGLIFLLISAIGFGLGAVFVSDPITATIASSHGKIHSLGAIIGGNIPMAAYLLGWSLARNQAWAALRRALLWTTVIALLGNVASIVMSIMIAGAQNKFGPALLVGWPNRLLIIAYAAWMMALAWRVFRLRHTNS